MRRFLIFAASLAALPAMAFAQGRAGGSFGGHMGSMTRGAGMARTAMAAPHFAARPSLSAAPRFAINSRPTAGMRLVRTRSGALVYRPAQLGTRRAPSPRSTRPVLSQDVPGLGFDYTHYAATHPQGTRGHGHGRERNAEFVGAYFPFYGGAYYMPIFPEDDELDEAPPANTQQVEAEEPQPAPSPEGPPVAQPSQDFVPAPSATPQDTDEYVFVRRDGTLFFATAFAWEKGTLRYITREGLRHTLTLDKLDLNATQQFNEQRGLNFRLPA